MTNLADLLNERLNGRGAVPASEGPVDRLKREAREAARAIHMARLSDKYRKMFDGQPDELVRDLWPHTSDSGLTVYIKVPGHWPISFDGEGYEIARVLTRTQLRRKRWFRKPEYETVHDYTWRQTCHTLADALVAAEKH